MQGRHLSSAATKCPPRVLDGTGARLLLPDAFRRPEAPELAAVHDP
jgi:hypothetical protein